MAAYYNEIDRHAAAWLRELIRRNLIAPGDVDERSIVDVRPDDLRGYGQCHFFAGIGGWSHALRLAGIPDDFPVWSGSCPCQPFSAAGRGEGIEDARHLWPAFFRLIRECRPQLVLGEQVAGKDGLAWLDHVAIDLEAESYACGAVSAPAAGFGAPHRRERLYWVADSMQRRHIAAGSAVGTMRGSDGRETDSKTTKDGGPACGVADGPGDGWDEGRAESAGIEGRHDAAERGPACGVADASNQGRQERLDRPSSIEEEAGAGERQQQPERYGTTGLLGDAIGAGLQEQRSQPGTSCGQTGADTGQAAVGAGASIVALGHAAGTGCEAERRPGIQFGGHADSAGPVNGFWADAEWIACRDGKARATGPGISPLVVGNSRLQQSSRRICETEGCIWESCHEPTSSGRGSVEPGTFPLAPGLPARVGPGGDCGPPADEVLNTAEARVMRLRGYGNAIASPQAAEFIRAVMDATGH